VQESKEKARDALGQAVEITNLIEQAEERTREAQNALAGAESDARVARDSAKQAQEHAEQASKVVKETFVQKGLGESNIFIIRTL
jgi:coxsackievirus/adenovirus receptor